jgi:hypothetical protein
MTVTMPTPTLTGIVVLTSPVTVDGTVISGVVRGRTRGGSVAATVGVGTVNSEP